MTNFLYYYARYAELNRAILKSLSLKSKTTINNHEHMVSLNSGDMLFQKHNRAEDIYLIRSGIVKLVQNGKRSKEHVIYLAGRGEFQGHLASLTDSIHNYSAICLTACYVTVIPKDTFNHIINTNAEALNKLIKSVSYGFNVLIEKNRILSHLSIKERTAISILKLETLFNDNNLDFKLPRKDHSNIVGTSVESLIRELKKLKESGLITINCKIITIIDRQKLELICNINPQIGQR